MYLLDRLFRRIIKRGDFTVIDCTGKAYRFGTPDPVLAPVTIRLTTAATARAIALNPAMGAGEGYMDGRMLIEQGDIRQLLDLVTWNLRFDGDNSVRTALWRQASIAAKLDQINFARRSKRNVAHHYDLDDRLYDLFLDPQRQYSCAYFTGDDMGLDDAQLAKLAHIAAKLDLRPGQRVLVIGVAESLSGRRESAASPGPHRGRRASCRSRRSRNIHGPPDADRRVGGVCAV